MRNISVHEITKNIKEMCIEANHFLSSDMKQVFEKAMRKEEAPLGKQILNQLVMMFPGDAQIEQLVQDIK